MISGLPRDDAESWLRLQEDRYLSRHGEGYRYVQSVLLDVGGFTFLTMKVSRGEKTDRKSFEVPVWAANTVYSHTCKHYDTPTQQKCTERKRAL